MKIFLKSLQNSKQYSKTQAVNKIYRLLRDLLDYKLKFVNYPRTSEKMVKLLNFLIDVVYRFDVNEIIIPTGIPLHYKKCVNLLMQVAAELPQEYGAQVYITYKTIEPNSLPQEAINSSRGTKK